MGFYRNLLEHVAPVDRLKAARDLLENAVNGTMRCTLGVLRESIGSGLFTALTADLTHKKLAKGFDDGLINAGDWRKLINVGKVVDFKDQNIVRTAGYTSLDLVPEAGRYLVKTFADEKAKYSIAKYGNMESWSLEAQANDELGALGRHMQRWGAAAARTLINFVFNNLIDSNPTTTYDATALFHANHANIVGTGKPLNPANLEAAWAKLRAQTGLGGEKLNLIPRILLVHTDQEVLANRLVSSELMMMAGEAAVNAFSENPSMNFYRGRLTVIASPYLVGGANYTWYLCATPDQADTIEVGFYNGQEIPDVAVEAPNSGHEFEMDAMRTRVRFIFGGTPIDHRWIVKATA